MGIKDLLKFMKPYVEPVHIKKYAGKRVGIDAYTWLHKGAYSCSMELCLDSDGNKKFRYLQYFMHRINLLKHYEVIPVVVFDGGNIPCKFTTDQERHRRRKANRDLAMEKLKEGNVGAASELFQRAVAITPSMAHQLIQILRSENIEFVVAPYEADAQLAYLSTLEAEQGGVVAVITEDSDLLAYGCQATLFKLDRFGSAEEIMLDKVFSSADCVPSFQKFDKELFTGMCVLAGCDFLPSVPGIGIVRAHSLVSKYRNLDRVLSVLKFGKGSQMPEDYSKFFKEASMVFQHARIYDAGSKRLKHMKPLSAELLQSIDEELDFLGPDIPPSVATAIAKGIVDPSNMKAFDHFQSSGNNLDSVDILTSDQIQTDDKFQKDEPTAVPTPRSCFTVLTSHKASEERIVKEQKLDEEGRKYLSESLALAKMALPLDFYGMQDGVKSSPDIPKKVPDNNPFRKRKLDELQQDETECVSELISEVTELENSSNLCKVTGSQKSVNSKPKTGNAEETGKAAKLKRSNCKSSESRKRTILNFFSRV